MEQFNFPRPVEKNEEEESVSERGHVKYSTESFQYSVDQHTRDLVFADLESMLNSRLDLEFRGAFPLDNGKTEVYFRQGPKRIQLLVEDWDESVENSIRNLRQKCHSMLERNKPNEGIELGYEIGGSEIGSLELSSTDTARLQALLIGFDESLEGREVFRENTFPEVSDTGRDIEVIGIDPKTGLRFFEYGSVVGSGFPLSFRSTEDYSWLKSPSRDEQGNLTIEGYLTLTQLAQLQDRGFDVSKLGLALPEDLNAVNEGLVQLKESVQRLLTEFEGRLQSQSSELLREDRVVMLRQVEELLRQIPHIPDNNWILVQAYEIIDRVVSDQVHVAGEAPDGAEELAYTREIGFSDPHSQMNRPAAIALGKYSDVQSFEPDQSFADQVGKRDNDSPVFYLDKYSPAVRVAKVAALLLGGDVITPKGDYEDPRIGDFDEMGRYRREGYTIYKTQ